VEIETLMEVVPCVPGYISSLDDMAASVGAPAKSRVDRASAILEAQRTTVDFPVTWVRSNGEVVFRARFVSETGMGFSGKQSIFVGSIVRLRIKAAPDAPEVEVAGRVSLSEPDSHGHRTEVHLFGLPGQTHGTWEAMLQGLRAAKTPAAGA
jgi:hypothetical protein